MDEQLKVIVTMAEAAGVTPQDIQKALGALSSDQLLTLTMMVTARTRQAVREGL
jgi:hypothetical protein